MNRIRGGNVVSPMQPGAKSSWLVHQLAAAQHRLFWNTAKEGEVGNAKLKKMAGLHSVRGHRHAVVPEWKGRGKAYSRTLSAGSPQRRAVQYRRWYWNCEVAIQAIVLICAFTSLTGWRGGSSVGTRWALRTPSRKDRPRGRLRSVHSCLWLPIGAAPG